MCNNKAIKQAVPKKCTLPVESADRRQTDTLKPQETCVQGKLNSMLLPGQC